MEDEKKKKRKRYIYVKKVRYEVDEKVYRAYKRPIWKIRSRVQRAGECFCPKNMLKFCDADCLICDYYLPQRDVSIFSRLPGDQEGLVINDTLTDYSEMPEPILLEKDLIDALHNAILQLEPDGRELCMLLKQYSQNEAAKIMGVSRATVNHRWGKIKKQLETLMWNYFLSKQ